MTVENNEDENYVPYDLDEKEFNVRSSMINKKKTFLPEKICVTCGRPYTWRKKWEKVWDEVKYCSDRCRKSR